jgi:molecular chaperone DnaK (HSP70)
MAKSRGKTIGIDLGTTYLGVASDGKMIPILYGNELWPSIAQITRRGKWSLRGLEKTPPVDWRMDVEFSKLLIGRPKSDGSLEGDVESIPGAAMDDRGACYTIFNRTYRPEEISAFLLGKIYQDIVKPRGVMDKVIITVPAYFGEAQRHSTLVAAEIAGFDPSVIDLVPEPVAAAVYVTRSWEKVHEKTVVVVDVGGGTTDLTVIQIFQEDRIRRFCVLAVVGDNRLGGKNLDDRLLDLVCARAEDKTGKRPEKKTIRAHCESAKQSLSVHDEVNIAIAIDDTEPPEINISRKEFISACRKEMRSFEQLLKILQSRERTVGEAQHLIFSGGSCNIPEIKALAKKACPKATIEEVVADKAVALGASCIASDPLITITPSLPKNIGIWCRNGQLQVIAKQTALLPGKFTGELFTHEETKDVIEFSVMEGDSADATRATEVSKFFITDLGCPPSGTMIKVTVKIAKPGTMDVEAKMTTEKGEEASCRVEFESPFCQDQLSRWKKQNSRRLTGRERGNHEEDDTGGLDSDIEAGVTGDIGTKDGEVELGDITDGHTEDGLDEGGSVEGGPGEDDAVDSSEIEAEEARDPGAKNGQAEADGTGDVEVGDGGAERDPTEGGEGQAIDTGDTETGDGEVENGSVGAGGTKPTDRDGVRASSQKRNGPSTRGTKTSGRARKRAKRGK